MTYPEFLHRKTQIGADCGFAPTFLPDFLFDFQKFIVDWAIRKGRSAIFADCGLGKTAMELVWAQNVVEKTNGRVLILAPIAVGAQTVREGEKFGIPCSQSRNGALNGKITVSNYEMLHKLNPSDWTGIVCDESSILKHFSGATQKEVTRFASKIPYRLLASATPAPNDFYELGTSSEALGHLGYSDMLGRFFRQTDNKPHRMQQIKDQKRELVASQFEGGNYFGKLSFRAAQAIGQWRLKPHAEIPFWRWVASWAIACRKPSDLGFDDARFVLPPLHEVSHVVKARTPRNGMLFDVPVFGMGEEREERRRTMQERCEKVASIASGAKQSIIWCQYNSEGDLLEKLIPGAVQVAGRHSDDEKEERLLGFCDGSVRHLVTKAKIAGFGLNFQHCSNVVTFVTHSYESYYQSVRRCWRFGQTKPVQVDIIATEGEQRVSANMQRKAVQAAELFAAILTWMGNAKNAKKTAEGGPVVVPTWMRAEHDN